MGDPIILRINRRKARRYAMMLGGGTLLMGVVLLAEIAEQGAPGPAGFFWLLFWPLMAFYAVRLAGMAFGTPVALRMDAQGISGFLAGPARWEDIAEVSVLRRTGTEDRRSLTEWLAGRDAITVTLHDPVAFRDHQSPFERLRSWWHGRQIGCHFVISTALTEDLDVDALLTQAQIYLAQTAPHQK